MDNKSKVLMTDKNLAEYTLSLPECDDLIVTIQEALELIKVTDNNSKEIRKATQDDKELAKVVDNRMPVLSVINSLEKYIRNKMNIVDIIGGQAKEVNDVYIKIRDLLQNDRWARFKHRDDLIDYEERYGILIDKNDKRKMYRLTLSKILINVDYLASQLTDAINAEKAKKGTINFKGKTQEIIAAVEADCKDDYLPVAITNPAMKNISYHNVTLDSVLKNCEANVDFAYRATYVWNEYVSAQLEYLQALKQAYLKLSNDCEKMKDAKKMVDDVVNFCLKYMTDSMNFNGKVVALTKEMVFYYGGVMNNIYEKVRSN